LCTEDLEDYPEVKERERKGEGEDEE